MGNNTFIGKGTILMPGISIGNNCIIGSLSVVSSSVPDNSVYVGSPRNSFVLLMNMANDC
ncbi:hypothetical protein LDL59_15575 [Kaistella anthropi]|nr:hypothetical protein [Kaistella anthropi]